jgi:DNA-binding transcriptional LysR family regulator
MPIESPLGPSRLINRLRLKHWALLATLAETSTLAQASIHLNTTQPSATKMLADIEQAFQFPLFERHPRGLRATPLGEEVVAYARQSQASLARFLEALEFKRRGGHGQLVLGAIMGAAPDLLAHAVAEIKRERPLLNVRILGETSDQVGSLLERQDIEFAVGRFSRLMQHNTFAFDPLANETMQLVVRRGHPLLRRKGLSMATLVAWPWILQPLTSPARQLMEEEFGAAGVSTPMNIVECASVFATLQLLQSSDAVGALPESVVRDHVRARLLRVLPLVIGEDLKGFGVLTRIGEPLSEAATTFIAHLRRFAGAGAGGRARRGAAREPRRV